MTETQVEWTKRGILVAGAVVAIIGSVSIETIIRGLDESQATAQARISASEQILARMREDRAAFITLFNQRTSSLLTALLTDPKHLDGWAARTAINETEVALTDLAKTACEASITSETLAVRELRCSQANREPVRWGAHAPATQTELSKEEDRLRKLTSEARVSYQETVYSLEQLLDADRATITATSSKKASWLRWQALSTVVGVIIVLAKDLVPKPTPGAYVA
jgi:hypothetical protein